jgi:hypothetical protein
LRLHGVALDHHKGFEGPMIKPSKSINPLGSFSDFFLGLYSLGLDDLFVNLVSKVDEILQIDIKK